MKHFRDLSNFSNSEVEPGAYEDRNYFSRKGLPAITMYFIRDDNDTEPYKLSCMFCKRTIADRMKGVIDKVVDGPMPANDHEFASNIQCKMCGQMYRLLMGASVPMPQESRL